MESRKQEEDLEQTREARSAEIYMLTQATPLQQQVFNLLDFKPTL
jgi:hypothetical protein